MADQGIRPGSLGGLGVRTRTGRKTDVQAITSAGAGQVTSDPCNGNKLGNGSVSPL
jgi:hypothetical protein